ncbi:hypothetical protein [Phycicoccus sp. DTK01]|uniref:hypothetical protein n=1 Tax=Phycicoccus sp. DTK01 TaxID=2785745 RepID=UPI001A8CCAE2|nr:hypothetical protein [Phycicoccus sp. DTK01]GIL34027.1 hypothetical protein PDTK01_01040 [Phycicoccus sp. DTK01]
MNDHEVMTALRSARPVDDETLSAVADRHALQALREGITMTDRHAPPTVETPRRGRRLGGRGLTAGTLGLVLVGGGVAVATNAWDRGPLLDGINCGTALEVSDGEVTLVGSVSGPSRTGDDVADCAALRSDAGMPPLADPEALTIGGVRYVVARAGVPAAARPSSVATVAEVDRAAHVALDAALADWVDGPQGGCFTATEAERYARGALGRAGLSKWTVRVVASGAVGSCAGVEVGADGRSVEVTPGARERIERGSGTVDETVLDAAEGLRRALAGRCLGVGEAETAARGVVGSTGRVVAVADDSLACADIDLVVGGAMEVTVRGPSSSRP